MTRLAFAKYEGIGNDFLLVDDEGGPPIDSAEAVLLCDRHRGVGADGVLLTGFAGSRPFVRILNADGSRPEMCGNGIRCVALHLVRTGRVPEGEIVIDTDAGPHRSVVIGTGEAALVEVFMRAASLEPVEIPVRAEVPLIDSAFEVAGTTLRLTAVSMGNPHAVTFDPVSDARETLGPRIEADPRFPRRVNVGFASLRADGGLDLAVWERGVGWTRACGTGACAAAVAAVETGRAQRGERIPVHLPGGVLEIVVPERGEPIRMTGPAHHVFDGTVHLEHLRSSSSR